VSRRGGAGLVVAAALGCGSGEKGDDTAVLAPDCLERVARHQGEEPLVYDLAWTPSGRQVLTGSTQLLRLFDVDDEAGTLTQVDAVASDVRFNGIVVTADGGLAVAPSGAHVLVFPLEDGVLGDAYVGEELPGEQNRVAISPDGSQLLTCDTFGRVHLHSFAQDPIHVALLDTLDVHSRCTRVTFSPSGELALSVGREGILALYRVGADSLTRVDHIQAREEVGDALFGLDDSIAVAGTFGDDNLMWTVSVDPSAGTLSRTDTFRVHASGFQSVDWDPGHRHLLTGGHDHDMHIWRTDDGGAHLERISDISSHGDGVHSARWSPDGSLVARTAANIDRLDLYRVNDCVSD